MRGWTTNPDRQPRSREWHGCRRIRRRSATKTLEARLGRALAEERARRLRRHTHRLTAEDLDDCLSQAALELVPRARRESPDARRHPGLSHGREQGPPGLPFRNAGTDSPGPQSSGVPREPGCKLTDRVATDDEDGAPRELARQADRA